MKIKGFIATTTIDYPGKVASVIFTAPCNMNCPMCHNGMFIKDDGKEWMSEVKFMELLESMKMLVDGVVISGGEPTLQQDLPEFTRKLKGMGLAVKVDTNGTNPDMLSKLIDLRSVDYFAMDIKTGFDRYTEYNQGEVVDVDTIKKSIALIRSTGDYEFRTTVVPGFVDMHDIEEISKYIKGAKRYSLQHFHNITANSKALRKVEPYSREFVESLKTIAEKYVEIVEIKG